MIPPHPPLPNASNSSRALSSKAIKASPAKVTDLLATALAIQDEDAAAAGQVGYMARAMIWASMPHRKIEGAHFKRDNGLATITMLVDPEIGLPYGKLPRLISAWLTREAKVSGSPELMLGRSLSEFADKLGLSNSGGKRGDISRLKVQAKKLFSTLITLQEHRGQELRYKNVVLSDDGLLLWNQQSPHERSLWESRITLSDSFYRECIDYAVPFDLRVLHHLRAPLAIDLYLWLTWRMFTLCRGRNRSVLVPWAALRLQFGAGYADTPRGMANFLSEFRRCLHDVCALYPAAKLSPEPNGLRLYPSPPHVKETPATRVLLTRHVGQDCGLPDLSTLKRQRGLNSPQMASGVASETVGRNGPR